MPRKVNPPPRGIWKQVARVQRLGLSGGMAGKGGPWLAVGIGAWGLQRLRSMAVKEDEILLREPLAPGETMTIRHQTTTRAEAAAEQKRLQREGKQLQQQAKAAEKAAKEARRRLSRAEKRQRAAQEAQAEAKASRRTRRRRS
ncbi:hypothetical protein HC251_10970 [Iamia sp. SCSIO 61187]|uniref:hypothetical protein n=1 Tax=Iamia sp. SCSIO 61187 TaxID=2722752 RepID=UPI001C62C9F5|nr:hypothetical protein [Iamia sp. SCSIO 61187]QYG92899.1 hypothetical protein HC251_10970 [Iamia sp. SCSIO 61187]